MSMYAKSGVDVGKADQGIVKIVEQIKSTWPKSGHGSVVMDVGYFANVVDIGDGRGIAMTTDGVGSKTVICDNMGKYDTIGIDCVAMNVNDLICVGARPLTMTDYIAVEKANPETLGQIAIGLAEGARQAGISINGGEISQLRDIVYGFDLAGSAIGEVQLDRIITGDRIEHRDVIIGIHSDGLHSNGYSLARESLLEEAFLDLDTPMPELGGRTLGEVLLQPTPIYVRPIRQVLDTLPYDSIKALVNITGDGLLNLNRVLRRNVNFVLTDLPRPPSIFDVIRDYGQVDEITLFEVFNMGVGFCLVVSPTVAERVISILSARGLESSVIGSVVIDTTQPEDSENVVTIPFYLLRGTGKGFTRITERDRD